MMTLSERLLEFKGEITTDMVPEQVLLLRSLVNNFADYAASLERDNDKLREIVEDWYPHMLKRVGPTALFQWGYIKTMVELGMDIYPLNKSELRESEG